MNVFNLMNLFMRLKTEMGLQGVLRHAEHSLALLPSSQTISTGFGSGDCGSCAGSAYLHFWINPPNRHPKSTPHAITPPAPYFAVVHTFPALHKDTAGETKDLKYGFSRAKHHWSNVHSLCVLAPNKTLLLVSFHEKWFLTIKAWIMQSPLNSWRMLCLLLELFVAFIWALIWGAVKLGFVRVVTWMNLFSAAEVSLCLPFLGRSSCEPFSSYRLKVFVVIFAGYFQSFCNFPDVKLKFSLYFALDFDTCQIGVSTVYQPDFCTRKLTVPARRNSTNEPWQYTSVRWRQFQVTTWLHSLREGQGVVKLSSYIHTLCAKIHKNDFAENIHRQKVVMNKVITSSHIEANFSVTIWKHVFFFFSMVEVQYWTI